MRLVSSAGTSNVRVLSSGGQTVRLAGTQHTAGSPISTTILRQQPTVLTTSSSPLGSGTTAATIGGKQILLQKPISLSGQNVLQLVKTSQGMAVQSVPKVNVVQKSGQTIQQQIAGGAQIVTAAGMSNQGKATLLGTNVVKLVSPGGVGGNKILMKNSNLVQVAGKVGTPNANKPAFVITNKQGQPIRSNQQFIFVTSAGGIRSVQSGSIVTSSTSNFVSLVSSPQVNTITSAIAGGTGQMVTPTGTVKMIRGQQGKPITFTLPVGGIQQGNKTVQQQLISMPQKQLTIGGKAVTVQLGQGNQKTVTIVSSGAGGMPKTINASDLQSGGHKIVMMPQKRVVQNVITHKTIPVSATRIEEASSSDNNLIEGSHLEVLDQLDGAFDTIELSSSDDDELLMPSGSNGSRLVAATKVVKTKRSVVAMRAIRKKRKQPKQLPKNVLPKFVKMGLFGGSPPDGVDNADADSSIVSQSDGGDDQQELLAETSTEQASADESMDNASQSTTETNDPEQQQSANEDTEQQAAESSVDSATAAEALANDSIDGPGALNESTDSKAEQEDASMTVDAPPAKAGPTPSETEAANILTTIKSGDLLRNNDIKSENGSITLNDENVTILFSSDPSVTNSNASGKKQISTYANSGDLDALASAALQASSGKYQNRLKSNEIPFNSFVKYSFDSMQVLNARWPYQK